MPRARAPVTAIWVLLRSNTPVSTTSAPAVPGASVTMRLSAAEIRAPSLMASRPLA